jgi:hypothetical protein
MLATQAPLTLEPQVSVTLEMRSHELFAYVLVILEISSHELFAYAGFEP